MTRYSGPMESGHSSGGSIPTPHLPTPLPGQHFSSLAEPLAHSQGNPYQAGPHGPGLASPGDPALGYGVLAPEWGVGVYLSNT